MKSFKQPDQTAEISGWEIWFQVEFYLFLRKQDKISDLSRESNYDYDKREEKNKNSLKVDFKFRQSNTLKNLYVLLEVKQAKEYSACLRRLKRDLQRISKMKLTQDDARSIWGLGIYQRVTNFSPESSLKATHFSIIDTEYDYVLLDYSHRLD